MISGFKILKAFWEMSLNHQNSHRETVGLETKKCIFYCGCDVVVAWNLAKVFVRVRFPPPALPVWLSGDSTAFVKRYTNTGGSSPSTGSILTAG